MGEVVIRRGEKEKERKIEKTLPEADSL